MIIHHRRERKANVPRIDNLEPLTMLEWQKQREENLPRRTALDEMYKQQYQVGNLYYELGNQIKERQQSKMPIVGKGLKEFNQVVRKAALPLAKAGFTPAKILVGSTYVTDAAVELKYSD
jgi:hypothetical protein